MLSFLTACTYLILANGIAFAQTIGLNPAVGNIAFSEVQTAQPALGQSLFYNPAALAWQGTRLRLANVDILLDRKSSNNAQELSQLQDSDFAKRSEAMIQGTQARQGLANVNLVDFQIPYVAFKSFSNIKSVLKYDTNSIDSVTDLSLGMIAGIAVKWKYVSLGVSKYVINKASVHFNPQNSDLDNLKTALTQNTLETELASNASKYTTAQYGQGVGTNVGLLIHFRENNQSGLGLSILNAGKTKFNSTSSVSTKSVGDIETKLKQNASQYGIIIGELDTLPEIKNAGLHLVTDDAVTFKSLEVDCNDIGGTYIKNKWAYATSFGFNLPSKLALALSTFVSEGKDAAIKYHVGLLKAAIHLSYRPFEVVSGGFELSLHTGIEKKLSLIELNLLALQNKSLKTDDSINDLSGGSVALNLIFMF